MYAHAVVNALENSAMFARLAARRPTRCSCAPTWRRGSKGHAALSNGTQTRVHGRKTQQHQGVHFANIVFLRTEIPRGWLDADHESQLNKNFVFRAPTGMPAWQPVVAFACGAEDCSTSQCGTSQHSKATTKAESVADGCLACPPNRSDFGSICHPSSPDASSDCHSLDSTVLVRHHLSPTRAGRAKHLTERGGNGKTEPRVDVACSVHAQLDQDLKACPPKEGGHAPDLGWICDVLTTGAEDFRPHVQDQDWDSYPRSHYPCKFYNREVISNDSKSTSSDRSTESNALHKLLRREHPAALDDVAHGDVLNICDILTSGGLDEI